MEEMTEKVKMRNEDTFGGSFPVRVYKVSTGWCQETHSHEYMQIWYVVSGSCTHIVEGAEYPLRAKNIFVIPPFVEHGLKDERDNFTIICCEFPAELITGDNLFDPAGRGLLRYTCIESFAAVLSRTRPCHTPGELSRVMLEQLLDEMLAEYDRRAEYYEIILKADVLKLLTLLARDYSEAMADGGAIVRSYSAYIDKAVAFIEENFRDKLHIEDAAKAVYAYNVRLIDALCDVVPAVKVQVAYYEMYGPAGMEVYEKTIRYAQEKGLIVMADVKRNDIGATAACYANAYIGKTDMPDGAQAAFGADIATINPYLGVDGIKPFADACRDNGTGVFVLVKTSNPSSGQLQDLRFEDGRTLYQAVADLVEEWGEETRGESGYSAVGAVVGATYPQQGVELRARMPHAFFLVPGYGAQGAKGTDIAGCFDANGNGAIVNASRSILCAWKKREGMAFDAAARDEALRMKEDLCSSLKAVGKEIK